MSPKILQVAPSVFTVLVLAFTPSLAGAQVVTPYAGDINPTFGSVTDTCAFSFVLYDATAGGTRVGPFIERILRVRGGLYETELDFGPEAFEGGSRYLEVAVGCPADTAVLTTLTRRAFHSTSSKPSDRGDVEQAATQGSSAPPKAALGTVFTYQGELKQSGAPVTGSGDFQFSLWDKLSGGVQIGSTLPVSAIAVEYGRFTASLDFGAAAFDGDARWLEIAVDYPSGTGSFTTLSPRQPLSAAPYALQTRGIYVDDTGEVGVGTTLPQAQLHVEADASRALRVRNTASSGGVAVQATAAGSTGWATAVDAYTASPDGVGVYAFNEAESGTAYAVAAESNSPDGVAIFGQTSNGDESSTGIGVHGRSDGGGLAAGVFGEATASTGYSYGVHGIAAAGAGVMGEYQGTENHGLLGTSNAGVVGHVVGTDYYAGFFTGGRSYFEGRVGIGTENPAYSLHVVGTAFVDGKLQIEYGHDLSFSDPANRIYEDLNDLRLESGDDIRINPLDDLIVDNGTLVVDSSLHRVGVGTSAPAAKLDVSGDIRSSGEYLYSTPRTLTRWISPPSFHEWRTYDADQFIMWGRAGYFDAGIDPLETTLYAQLVLPDGAYINELWVYYDDNDPSVDLEVGLHMSYIELLSGHTGGMANITGSTSGASSAIQSIGVDSVGSANVDNEDRFYIITIDLSQDSLSAGSDVHFFGCRVVYSMSQVNP